MWCDGHERFLVTFVLLFISVKVTNSNKFRLNPSEFHNVNSYVKSLLSTYWLVQ